jgi:hypothetical protein
VSPSSPPLLYPIRHDLVRLLIHLLCSNLQQIEPFFIKPKLITAESPPAASPRRFQKQTKTLTMRSSSP